MACVKSSLEGYDSGAGTSRCDLHGNTNLLSGCLFSPGVLLLGTICSLAFLYYPGQGTFLCHHPMEPVPSGHTGTPSTCLPRKHKVCHWRVSEGQCPEHSMPPLKASLFLFPPTQLKSAGRSSYLQIKWIQGIGAGWERPGREGPVVAEHPDCPGESALPSSSSSVPRRHSAGGCHAEMSGCHP